MKTNYSDTHLTQPLKSFVAFVAILFTVIYFLTPLYGDDLWFLIGTNLSESRWHTFIITLEGTARRWQTETGRFANIMSSPFIALFPKWLLDLLCGFMVWCLMTLSLRMASIRKSNTTGWLLIASVVLFLPWYDSMFSRMFTINYVWTSVLDLCFILLMFKTFSGYRFTRFAVVAITLLSFCSGWMHEGFSVPLICAFGVMIICRRKHKLPVPGLSYLYLFFFCLGAFIITLSPMFRHRAGGEGTTFADMPLWEIAVMAGPAVMLFIILVIVAIIRRRHIFSDWRKVQILLLSVTVSAVSLLITACFFGGPRACFFSELLDFIALAMFLQKESDNDERISLSALLLRLFSVILVTVNLLYAVSAQAEFEKENDRITELFINSPDGKVFYDNIAMRPDCALLKTSAGQFNLKNLILDFSYYHRSTHSDPDSQKLLQLLPSTLADFSGEASLGNGLCPDTPVLFNGNILIPASVFEEQSPQMIVVETGDSRQLESRFRAVTFTAPDSTQWVLIKPHATVYRTMDIKGARFHE